MYRLVATSSSAFAPAVRGCRCRRAAATALPRSIPLHTSCRTYYWPYNEDFVPAGATTSAFQSSGVPSVRERIVREYALGPLFGARTPCCRLGFAQPARDLLGRKAALASHLAALLSCSPADLQLGDLEQAKEMLLHREGLAESPRLGDGAGTKGAAARRLRQYARQPVVAKTVVAVYYKPTRTTAAIAEDDEEEEELLAMGMYVQDCLAAAATASSESTANATVAPAAAALRALGVVHCEVPLLDSSDFAFQELHGEAVDEGLAQRVWERWERRLAQLDEVSLNSKTPLSTSGQGKGTTAAAAAPATPSPP